ncbi:LtrA domain containing protein [Pyrenophora tritici-repentis]|uniref:Bacterial low temperature requirement A protein n=1 Tax=Pyrenophora tritici-repentis TaxID=45151 RepID=A0A2W1GB60_9PLEO|nr:Bacterial low temperature requirement A protein [Pyrenophora tritici-repentis]KAI1564664.1 LtrA domain containing protein [Pyrenophora tritici-repentis]KAI1565524.1 LtrA domain containing protein [Pyrenophora tritici-repentis]KAI1663374.1 Bacterial low temperature requirement A protein [Pyrenophora tritici-repentis]KAI1680336.1 Bacterial low temperature requirement A protein [Pyrenophora tritici-repentis]
MDLARYFSLRRKTTDSHGHHHSGHAKDRTPLPLLANPINEDVLEVFSGSSDLEKTNTHTGTLDSSNDTTTLAGNGRTSRGNIIIYKQHTEASTIELFYDLFFVANLAYFTAMHQHTDAESLINYLKLFTLMWFNWLSVTLFDVRFSLDSVWSRIHKAIQFGIFTGFVYAGPVFDKYNNTGDGTSYRNFAIVLVIGRLAIASQYLVVMWQGRMFRQTVLPIGLSAGVHVGAAVGYGVTIGFPPGGATRLVEQVPWVVICIAEGLCIFLIAMVWRIISFKYTHLVERLQLLTLIIIGEGIIGMVKSVSCITKGQYSNNMSEIGTVIAAVILLYLVWMLYFDQLSHDRFGTVRQQIWGLLHYPLHSAIVLCVEGNTSLIVWNSAVQALKHIWSMQPDDYADPADGYSTTSDYLTYLTQTMHSVNATFKAKTWSATYNWTTNFTAIQTYTSTYGFRSEEWNNRTGDVVRYMFDRAQVFAYEAHADSLAKLNAVTSTTSSPGVKLTAVSDVFNTTTMQFFIGAGCMLLVLAMMYWFNKVHKTKYEFGEIINRVIVGFTLVILGISLVVTDKTEEGFKYGGILTLDNILLAIAQYTTNHPRHPRHPRNNLHKHHTSWGAGATTTLHNYSSDDTYPSRTPSPGNTPRWNNNTVKGIRRSKAHASTASLAKVHTSNSPPEQYRRGNGHATPHRAFTASDVTLHDSTSIFNPNTYTYTHHTATSPANANTTDFSYQNTPTSALADHGQPRGLGIGIEVQGPSTSTPSLHTTNTQHDQSGGRERLKEKASCKNLGVMREPNYDTRANGSAGAQRRTRTVSFGDEGCDGSG